MIKKVRLRNLPTSVLFVHVAYQRYFERTCKAPYQAYLVKLSAQSPIEVPGVVPVMCELKASVNTIVYNLQTIQYK